MKLFRTTITTVLLLVVGGVHAANITWNAVEDYSAPTDVRTEGMLIEAVNATGVVGAASPVINGVTFTADSTLLDDDATTDFLGGDTGDVAYNQFLNSLDYGSSGTFQIGGGLLDVGKTYLVQAWYVDERSGSDARAMQFGDGAGNLSDEVNDQFVTGTFVANGSSQTFVVSAVSSGPHFTGYQLRDLSSALPTLSSGVGETVSGSFSVSVAFSESISGLGTRGFTTVNCTISDVSGRGVDWIVTVNPINNGDVAVTLPANSVLDSENHGNAVSNTIQTTYVAAGAEQPVPTLSTRATDVYGDYTVNVAFNESVTGLQLSDFEISGGTAANLSGSDASYSIVVSPDFGGDVIVRLPKNSVTDTDGDVLQNVVSNELVNAFYVEVTVNSPAELLPYLDQDNVTATLAPGTYTIDASDVRSTYGTPRFEFWGSNSTYDFTGVTINFAADIYDSDLGMSHMQIFGNNNVLKNLRMIDLCDKYGELSLDGGVNLVIDGEYNRVEGFYFEIRGSYPYGYGDCFGKGGTYTIKHSKHSGVLVRGNYNHLLNCTLMQQSYGHCIFMQGASYPTIEGCYVEAEVRSTDDMLAETSGPAFDIDFMTVWGFTLPAGYMKATCEGGIRAYNGGNTYVNGVWISRGTDNPTILDNTLVNTRTGVTLTHATGTKYVSGCTTIGTERGYAIGSGIIENCYSDVKHGPAFGVDYDSDSGIIADITIIPHVGAHYNGSKHVAYITGKNHQLTFRGVEQNPELDLEINMGGDRRIESSYGEVDDYLANNISINNLTGYPLVLDDNSTGNTGKSIGAVTDAGTSNGFALATWDVATNLAFLGTATQSSNAYDTIASFATDQNTNGNFTSGSVTHTNIEAQAWWEIDLKSAVNIAEIKIWNRTNSNQGRLSDYDVMILNSSEEPVWSSYQEDYPDPSVSLLPDTSGQYVLIQLRGTNALSLAEVEIFGVVITGPSGLTAVSDSSQIMLNWDVVADATDYTVKRSTSPGGIYTILATTTDTTYNDDTALNGTFYYYVVTATINGDESPPSNEAIVSLDIAKLIVSAGNITASEHQDPNVPIHTIDEDLETRWSASGDGQWIRYDLGAMINVHSLKIAWFNGASRQSSFDVEVSNDDATWTSITGGTLQSSGETNALESVEVAETLARYVRIVGYGNSSNDWNSMTELEIYGSIVPLPSVPLDLSATPSDGQVALSWSVSEGATLHHLKRSTTNVGEFATIASEAGGSYVDTNVDNGTVYYYIVSAASAAGESANTAPVSTKPYAPISSDELVVPTVGRQGDSLELSFVSVPGRIYQLQRNETLAVEGWGYVGEPVTGTGASIMLVDPDAFNLPKCFYRLEINP